jgi:hypothetical protein
MRHGIAGAQCHELNFFFAGNINYFRSIRSHQHHIYTEGLIGKALGFFYFRAHPSAGTPPAEIMPAPPRWKSAAAKLASEVQAMPPGLLVILFPSKEVNLVFICKPPA